MKDEERFASASFDDRHLRVCGLDYGLFPSRQMFSPEKDGSKVSDYAGRAEPSWSSALLSEYGRAGARTVSAKIVRKTKDQRDGTDLDEPSKSFDILAHFRLISDY
jgi:hypothetical protein